MKNTSFNLYNKNDDEDNYNNRYSIPRTWFVNDQKVEEYWEGSIKFAFNKYFSFIGFLSTLKREYFCYKKEDDYSSESGHFNFGESSIAYHVRNSQTKEFPYLVLMTQGDLSKVFCFYNYD